MEAVALDNEELVESVGQRTINEFKAELSLLDDAGNAFNVDDFLAGKLTPVFFGSAMTNFGVEPFLDRFTNLCPAPRARSPGMPRPWTRSTTRSRPRRLRRWP